MENINNYLIIPHSDYQDIEILKYNLVSNLDFQKLWSKLANTLGFIVNLSSNMNISKLNSDYIIHEGTSPSENSFQMIISDFRFEFLPESISFEPQIFDNLIPEVLTTTNVKNESDSTVKTTKTFSFKTSKKTTVSSSHKITNSLSVKKTGSASLLVVSTKIGVNFKFSHQYTLGYQQASLESTQFTETVNVSIPPKSKLPIKLVSYKSKITTPFTAFVKIIYNITFKGPFNVSNSPHKENSVSNNVGPMIKPFSFTFGKDGLSANEDLRKQYIQSHIPGATPWNWNLMNSNVLVTFLTSLFKGFASQINGKFEKDDSSIINIETGPPSAL